MEKMIFHKLFTQNKNKHDTLAIFLLLPFTPSCVQVLVTTDYDPGHMFQNSLFSGLLALKT